MQLTIHPEPRPTLEVSQAEYERLIALGLVVGAPADPQPVDYFDNEIAALIGDTTPSATRAAITGLVDPPVDSVNGQTGVVVLDADDIADAGTKVIMTSAERTKLTGVATGATANSSDATLLNRTNHTGTQAAATISDLTETVQDVVGALIVAGTGVTVSYDDVANTFTVNATGGGGTTDPEIVRDVIGTALVAGSGIQITVNDAGDSITIASTAVLPTRQVASGTGLTGGGDLSANRTLAVSYGTAAGTAVQGNDTRVTADQAAGTASIRTLGTGAQQAAAGNHTHADKLGIVAGSGLTDVHQVTQAAYDALGAGRPAGRIYFIVG